jgi:hypothetical protein
MSELNCVSKPRVEAFKVLAIQDQGEGVFHGRVVRENLDRCAAETAATMANANSIYLGLYETLKYQVW